MTDQRTAEKMGTYWLPKGTKVICNGIEVILDDDTNSILAREIDWPELQRAFFPEEDWDDFEELMEDNPPVRPEDIR